MSEEHNPEDLAVNGRSGNAIPHQGEDAVVGAIDAIMCSQQQTYDQFLKGFTQLTMADVTKSRPSTMQKELNAGHLQQLLATIESQLRPDLSPTEISAETVETSTSECNLKEEDNLEEEVLDEGIKSVDPLLRDHHTSASTKVDNFFNESDTESLEDGEMGYNASFSTPETGNGIYEDTSEEREFRNVRLEIGNEKEKSSDIITSDECSHYITDVDIKSNYEKQMVGNKEGVDSDTDNAFSESQCDILNPGEVENFNIHPQQLLDNDRILDFSTSSQPVIDKLSTQSTKCEETKSTSASNVSDTEHVDHVQSFQLDDDFDYDNVTLTPKFTSSEMQYLSSLQQTKSPVS